MMKVVSGGCCSLLSISVGLLFYKWWYTSYLVNAARCCQSRWVCSFINDDTRLSGGCWSLLSILVLLFLYQDEGLIRYLLLSCQVVLLSKLVIFCWLFSINQAVVISGSQLWNIMSKSVMAGLSSSWLVYIRQDRWRHIRWWSPNCKRPAKKLNKRN